MSDLKDFYQINSYLEKLVPERPEELKAMEAFAEQTQLSNHRTGVRVPVLSDRTHGEGTVDVRDGIGIWLFDRLVRKSSDGEWWW